MTTSTTKKDYDAIERGTTETTGGTTETSTLLDPTIIFEERNSLKNRAFVMASLVATMMVMVMMMMVLVATSSSSAMNDSSSAAASLSLASVVLETTDSDSDFVLPTYCVPPTILSKSRRYGSLINCGDIPKCGKVFKLEACLFEFECAESCTDPYRDMTDLEDFYYRNIPLENRPPEYGGPVE